MSSYTHINLFFINLLFINLQCILKIVGCSSVFKKLHKEVSKMATPYPFVTTEQLCRLTCLFEPKCVSYQIDRNQVATFCWIQTNGDNLKENERTKRVMVTEYILVDSCTDKPLEKTDRGLNHVNILKISLHLR